MRRQRSLDMLPLLDIFMVVLFVFATIQEDKLDEAQSETTELEDELNRAEADRAQLREQVSAAKTALAQRPEVAPGQRDAIRQDDVLAKLLDHFTVIEVEITGDLDEAGRVTNRCCYRGDPFSTQWQSCGHVPPRQDARLEWLEGGAAGLLASLRRTRGGNVMTIIRQNDVATYRIANHLDAVLRERFVDHKVYNEGVAATPVQCE